MSENHDGGGGSASAYEAREAQVGRADAVVVAERAALLAQDHGAQVAHARLVRAHAAASRHADVGVLIRGRRAGGPRRHARRPLHEDVLPHVVRPVFIYLIMRHDGDGQLAQHDGRGAGGGARGAGQQRGRRPQLPPQRVAVGAVLDHRLADLVAALEVHRARGNLV